MDSLGKNICGQLTIKEILASVPSKTFTAADFRTRQSLFQAVECQTLQLRYQIRQAAAAKASVSSLKAKIRKQYKQTQRRDNALLKREATGA
jgi:hypothetical protein